MSDSSQHLDTIAVANAQQAVTANALFDAMSPGALFGRRASTTAALTWGYYGGKVLLDGAPTEWPDATEVGTLTLTDNKTQFLELHRVSATTFTVTAFTVGATPTVTTSASHGFAIGQTVYFASLGGMTQMNGAFATILSTPTATTFTIDTSTATGFTTYTSGGTVAGCGASGTLRLGKNHGSTYSPGSTPLYQVVTSGGAVSSHRDDRIQGIFPGRVAKSVAGSANVVLTNAEARASQIELTGTLTGNIAVIFPPVVREWVIFNNTAGPFTLTPRTPSGTGSTVTQATRERRACDGVDLYEF